MSLFQKMTSFTLIQRARTRMLSRTHFLYANHRSQTMTMSLTTSAFPNATPSHIQTFTNSKQWQQQQQQQLRHFNQLNNQASIDDLTRLCQEGNVKEAIELLEKGAKADSNCFVLLFDLCGKSKSLEDAKKVHNHFRQSTHYRKDDYKLNNRVIEMYANCKSMTDACSVFDRMPNRNMDTWHLMICGYADSNNGVKALQVFTDMFDWEITSETFLAVLHACASIEAVEEAYLHFKSMESVYEIEPRMEHYIGLLAVLGKSGHLKEAKEFIEKLPFEPTVTFWEILKNYARIHGDIDLEDHAEELIVSLDPSKAVANKIPTPPVKYNAISMFDCKNRIIEYKNPTLYKDDQEAKEEALLYHSESLV